MGAKVDVFMPLYVSDFDRDTKRLTLEEDGAYNRLLRDYWVSGAPPDDDRVLALIVRVELKHWRKLRPALIGFFQVKDGRWYQKRVEAELAKARERREIAAENGRRGGRPKKQTVTQGKPSGLAVGNPEHNPEHNPECNPGCNPEKSSSPSPSHSSLRSEENHAVPGVGAINLEAFANARLAQVSSLLASLQSAAGEAMVDIASAPVLAHPGAILSLLEPGEGPACDLELDVLPTVRRLCARRKPRSLSTWSYFTNAIVEARDARLRGAPAISEEPNDHGHRNASGPGADPDSRRANTERRRDAWTALDQERAGEGAGGNHAGYGAGSNSGGDPGYPRLAHTG